ncbi:MAG: DNA-formamidopyrimidine glycosylase [Bacilli bacterium]|nr:DNA-formamidopyrimidine glycosylase [Bacilli bacterium]
MPELPEVRTVASILKNELINKKITDIKVLYSKIISKDSLSINLLINNKLKDIKTNGKYILFDYGKYILLSHLRMEGKYFIKDKDSPIEKHEHIIFIFDDNISLRYHDTRKFGKVELIKKEELGNNKRISKLALEPFDIDANELYQKIIKKKTSIKTILLDQTIINGLGNIYANEVLYDSEINPFKLGKDITLNEVKKIVSSAIKILNLAILNRGTTIRTYTATIGVTGNYQKYLKVHMKDKEKCPKCHNNIIKVKINGRSTYYCKVCQK